MLEAQHNISILAYVDVSYGREIHEGADDDVGHLRMNLGVMANEYVIIMILLLHLHSIRMATRIICILLMT